MTEITADQYLDFYQRTGTFPPSSSIKSSIPRQQIFLDYEIRSSWWAELIWFEWGQNLAASYFVWKVKRKYKRYLISRNILEQLKSKNIL
jgi:hypothetical protein